MIRIFLKNKWRKKQIKTVFASCDSDLNSFNECYETIPWVVINFENEMKDIIGEAFEINCIPGLLVFDNKCNMIDQNGRYIVEKYKDYGYTKENAEKVIKEWMDKVKK